MRLSLRTSVVGAIALTLGMAVALPAYGSSNKPTSTGGSPITKYVATAAPSGKSCTAMGLSCKVAGLKNGTSYTFTVAAYNKNGVGTRSMPSNKVTPKAGTASVRTIVVTPSTGLSNGQSVTVTGSGFTPNDSVFLIECLATSTSQAGCNVASATPATVSAKGTIAATTFKVTTGTIGNGKCGTTAANAGACAINIGNITGGDSAQGLIKFKP